MKNVSRIILIIVSVVLAVLLAATSLYAAALYTVRSHYTPEYIYNFMNSLDYAALEIPDGNGGSGTVRDLANAAVADFGISFSGPDLNSAIRSLSIDAIFTSFVQDVRSWAFDDGSVPSLNANEMTDTILSGIDQSLLMFLSMFGDVDALLYDAMSAVADSAELDAAFEKAEPYRTLLSEGTLIFAVSVCATLVLLILVTRRLKLVPTAVFSGCSWVVSGALLLFADKLLAPFKAQITAEVPEATFDLIYLPLIEALQNTGTFMALSGLVIVVVFAVFGSFAGMIKREKQKTAEAQAKREAMMRNNGEYGV